MQEIFSWCPMLFFISGCCAALRKNAYVLFLRSCLGILIGLAASNPVHERFTVAGIIAANIFIIESRVLCLIHLSILNVVYFVSIFVSFIQTCAFESSNLQLQNGHCESNIETSHCGLLRFEIKNNLYSCYLCYRVTVGFLYKDDYVDELN